MEQEKEQLNKKIKSHKKKTSGREGFQQLLDVISQMRHEQEEETNLLDKLREQKRMLDFSDQQLLNSQQRLLDTKKNMGDETSAEEMLRNLKSDVAKHRQRLDELQFDINEKRKQLVENEKKLYEQLPSREAIQEMENRTMKLRNLVADLETKLERDQDKEKNDMIALQKRQVGLIRKQREKVEEGMKKYEKDKNELEAKLQTKSRELVNFTFF